MCVKVLAVLGHKNSGKTRLATMLIKKFTEMGYSVASAKHVHHAGFSIDVRGKDSWLHSEAGARPTIIVSHDEVAVIWRDRRIRDIREIMELVGKVDILVLEGFYRMLSNIEHIVKVTLLRDLDDLKTLGDGLRASFKNLGSSNIYKLPEEFPNLFQEILRKLDRI